MNKKTGLIASVALLLVLLVLAGVSLLGRSNGSEEELTKDEINEMVEGGRQAETEEAEQLAADPILEYIPYEVEEYSADLTSYKHYEIRLGEEVKTIVILDYTGESKSEAYEKLVEFGLNFSEYAVEYTDKSAEYRSVRVSDN